ncbi:hypothetical protein NM208_g9934 [Fusarium decemcellulare]|uniref:Uncharacterized protein n=1 Tax=Fusarium decemcellulare TaxID=57161 RepID=A0ACC1RZQ0_9HYPO|nr:hypothetical protein NM208_g9934 [Fusarium decemcellulare]
MEKHTQTTSTVEKLFHCPNANCKRSKEEHPFKRSEHLKRHLETCKHNRDTSSSQEEREPTLSTSAPPNEMCRPAALPVEATASNSRKKRPRWEDEEDELGNEQTVRRIVKQLRRVSEEVEERKRKYLRSLNELKSLKTAIKVFQRKSKGVA